MLDCLQRGQVGVAVLFPLLLGLRLTLTGSRAWTPAAGGALLALPVAIKVTPVLPVALYAALLALARPRWRALASWSGILVGTALLWIAIPAAAVGWSENLHLLARWRDTVAANEELAVDRGINPLAQSNQSLAVALLRVREIGRHGFPPPLRADQADPHSARLAPFPPRTASDWRDPITPLRIALLLLLVAAAARLGRSADPSGLAAVFGLGCAGTLLISPISWGHHFVLLFPTALLVPAWFLLNGWRRAAKLTAATLAGLALVHYVWMPVAGPLSVLALGLAAWFLIVCAAVLWIREGRTACRH
jgi:hypothetical protein